MRDTIKKGIRFRHSRILDSRLYDGKSKQACIISAVRGGMVYFKCDYGAHDDGTPWLGSGGKFPIEQAPKWIAEII